MTPNAARLELVKGAALVAMVADHVDLAVFDRSVPALHLVGQFAFPAFCLTYGIGLARSSDPLRAVERLLIPAVVAQLAWYFIRPGHPANVLFVFALCAVAAWAATRSRAAGAAALAFLVGVGAFAFEGGIFGPVLAACGYLGGRLGRLWPVVAGGVAWALLAPSFGAYVAAIVVPLAAIAGPIIPKLPAFPWLYAAHLALLAAFATAVPKDGAPSALVIEARDAVRPASLGASPSDVFLTR